MKLTKAEVARLSQATVPVTRVAYMAHGVMECQHAGPIDATAHLGRIASDLAHDAAMRGWPTHCLTSDEAATLLDRYLARQPRQAAEH